MQDLYFIALVPPSEVAKQIDELRHQAAQNFGSSHTLKSPPHITLAAPFKLREVDPEKLKSTLKEVAEKCTAPELKACGFGHFGNRSIYIAVKQNDQLSLLKEQLVKSLQEIGVAGEAAEQQKFHPHFSIATRDLHHSKFKAAWDYFRQRSFSSSFMQKDFVLLHHSGSRWLIEESYELGGS